MDEDVGYGWYVVMKAQTASKPSKDILYNATMHYKNSLSFVFLYFQKIIIICFSVYKKIG